MDWMALKEVVGGLALEKDALHVYAAFSVQAGAAAVFRKPLSKWHPWLAVLAAELANESFDLWFGEEPEVRPWQIAGATHDIINTMILPTALLLLCRFSPRLFNQEVRSEVAEPADSAA